MTDTAKRFGAVLSAAILLLTVTGPVRAEESVQASLTGSASSSEDPELLPDYTPMMNTEPSPTETTEASPTEAQDTTVSAAERAVTSETVPQETEPEEDEGEREFPLYSQLDYPNKRFGSGTVATSGCSITSLAMVATYLTGHTYLPDELADYFGGYGVNNVERLEYGAQQLRLPMRKANNIREVFAALEDGDVAILLMNHTSIFTESQHFIVLTGLNEDGKIMVADSYPPNYEKWELKLGFQWGFDEDEIMLGYHGGWIFDVSAVPDEPFIYEEEKPYVEPRYPEVELTWDEQQLLAKLIWLFSSV